MLKRIICTGLVLATLTTTMIQPAYAAPNDNSGPAKKCIYKGAESSEGAKVKQDDGHTYECHNGNWLQLKDEKPCKCQDAGHLATGSRSRSPRSARTTGVTNAQR